MSDKIIEIWGEIFDRPDHEECYITVGDLKALILAKNCELLEDILVDLPQLIVDKDKLVEMVIQQARQHNQKIGELESKIRSIKSRIS